MSDTAKRTLIYLIYGYGVAMVSAGLATSFHWGAILGGVVLAVGSYFMGRSDGQDDARES